MESKQGRGNSFVFFIDSGHGFPYAVADARARQEDRRVALLGEIYEVDDAVLSRLDELEEHPKVRGTSVARSRSRLPRSQLLERGSTCSKTTMSWRSLPRIRRRTAQ